MDTRLNNGFLLKLHRLEKMVINTLAGVTNVVNMYHHHYHHHHPPPPPPHQQHHHHYHHRHQHLFSSLNV